MSFCDKIQFCVLKFYGVDVNILESWRRLVDDFANNIVNRDGEILVTFNFSLFSRVIKYLHERAAVPAAALLLYL